MRIAAAQPPASREDGFILIEVLVSALILAIVAAAVLAVLSSTTRSAASARVHSQAVALAQEDQARLRTMRITKLNRLNESQPPIELDGTKFTVTSTGTFVNNTTGTVTCAGGETSVTDYVEITSSVSASGMQNPVLLRSIVSPSNGSLDPTHGTISFKAVNSSNQPLPGVVISGSGPGSFKGETDINGCANFADLTTGEYSVATSAAGKVNMQGETTGSKIIGAPSAGTQAVSLFFDTPGSVKLSFKYRVGNTSTYQEAAADSVEVYNGDRGTTPATVLAPGGTRALKVEAPNLYPFSSKYTIYGGSCSTNNPDPKEEKLNQEAIAFVQVEKGKTAEPAPIQLPALNLTIQNSSGTPVSGATVTLTDTNSNCRLNGSPVKRVYTTNTSGNPSNGPNGPAEFGLPWGKYSVCASTGSNRSFRVVTLSSVTVENLGNWESKTLKLPSSANQTSGC